MNSQNDDDLICLGEMDEERWRTLTRRYWRPLPAKPGDPDRLSILPAELRNIIFELALATPNTIYIRERSSRHAKEPPLLRVSKQIRCEAMQIHYSINSFIMPLHIHPKEMPWTVRKLRSIVEICGPKPFNQFKFEMRTPVNRDFRPLLQLLILIRETGFTLPSHKVKLGEYNDRFKGGSRVFTIAESNFLMSDIGMGMLQEQLERAVAMALRAREKACGDQDLKDAFLKWCADYTSSARKMRAFSW